MWSLAVTARRQQRVHAAGPPSTCWASAPGYSEAISATTWRGPLRVSSAHSTTAPRETSQPSRPARRTTSRRSIASGRSRSSSRNEPRTFSSTSSRASSTATSVSAATAARCRNSTASGSGRPGCEQHDAADPLVAGRDRHLGDDLARHRRDAATALLADVAAHRGEDGFAARGGDRHAEPRHDDRDRAAGGPCRQVSYRRQPVAGQHGVEHLQMHRAQPLDERVAAGGVMSGSAGMSPAMNGAARRPPRLEFRRWPVRPPQGVPGASPHRTRRCGSGRPPRPA